MDEQEPQVYQTIPENESPPRPAVRSHDDTSVQYTTRSEGGGRSHYNGRTKTMKQLQREITRRNNDRRSRPSLHGNPIREDDDGNDNENKKDDNNNTNSNNTPFKPLTDLLFQTAVLGINTTASLGSKVAAPSLSHVIFPLFRELYVEYTPIRIQTWMKVLPPTLSNVYDLLWESESGTVLGSKLNDVRDDIIDTASTHTARQCVIDFTVLLIKWMEALHTPEIHALLDQSAVTICRFVDVWSSGKAKQLWLDLSSSLWAAIEVGSDPLVVMTLAEGCAQICFALEEERASLKAYREREFTAGRRKVRDERQKEMYPVDGGGEVSGREGVEKALMHTLSGERKYSSDSLGGGPIPSVILKDGEEPDATPTLDPIERVQDGESEISTEIEDLGETTTGDSEKNWTPIDSGGKKITYEQGDNDSSPNLDEDEDPDACSNDQEASEAYDAFQESILQFHRRLNEVLDEAKGAKLSSVIEKKLKDSNKLRRGDSNNETDNQLDDSQSSFANARQSLAKRRWKILKLASIGFSATVTMTWFALGCYRFYTLFLGGQSSTLPQQQQPVVIQVMAGGSTQASNFASMSLEEWKQMSRDVETLIRKQTDEL